jgi:TfoX/Sxy family transcriptional regulator of competence genes
MASSKAYLDYILERLSTLDGITYRAMMGEFLLYHKGKLFGGIYDDRFLVKPVKSAREMMPYAEMVPPYAGAKEMLLVGDDKDEEFLHIMVEAICQTENSPSEPSAK